MKKHSFSPEAMAKSHGPEARAKAMATRKKTLEAKRAAQMNAEIEKVVDGETSTIDVSTIQLPPFKRRRKGHRRHFTPAERLACLERIDALLAAGKTIKRACKITRIRRSMYREWDRRRDEYKKRVAGVQPTNGSAPPSTKAVVSMRYNKEMNMIFIVFAIGDKEVHVSHFEAARIATGLANLGF